MQQQAHRWEERTSTRTGLKFYSLRLEDGITLAQSIEPWVTSEIQGVARHYDEVTQQAQKHAQTEQYVGNIQVGVRRLNNWVKAQTIAAAARAYTGDAPITVLDIAAGKMGDRRKWCASFPPSRPVDAYVHTDVSALSVAEAVRRKDADAAAGKPVPPKFMPVVMDWTRAATLPQVFIPANQAVTHVNLMFCANYFWDWATPKPAAATGLPNSRAHIQDIMAAVTRLCAPGAVLAIAWTEAGQLLDVMKEGRATAHTLVTTREIGLGPTYSFSLDGAVHDMEENTVWQSDITAVLVSLGWEMVSLVKHDVAVRKEASSPHPFKGWPDRKKDAAQWDAWTQDPAVNGTLAVYRSNVWVLGGVAREKGVKLGKRKALH